MARLLNHGGPIMKVVWPIIESRPTTGLLSTVRVRRAYLYWRLTHITENPRSHGTNIVITWDAATPGSVEGLCRVMRLFHAQVLAADEV